MKRTLSPLVIPAVEPESIKTISLDFPEYGSLDSGPVAGMTYNTSSIQRQNGARIMDINI